MYSCLHSGFALGDLELLIFSKADIFYICVLYRHCVIVGEMCRLLSSATVYKVFRDRQTAGRFGILDRKRLLVSIFNLMNYTPPSEYLMNYNSLQ